MIKTLGNLEVTYLTQTQEYNSQGYTISSPTSSDQGGEPITKSHGPRIAQQGHNNSKAPHYIVLISYVVNLVFLSVKVEVLNLSHVVENSLNLLKYFL